MQYDDGDGDSGIASSTGTTPPETGAAILPITPTPPPDAPSGPGLWRPGNSWASRISWTYCRNQNAIWLALALTIAFMIIATGMNVHYRCWQWRTDPVGAAVIGRRKRRLPIPYSYFG